MNENDMFICNDVRIIREAAKTAIELSAESRRIFNRKTVVKLAHENLSLVMDLINIIGDLLLVIKKQKEVNHDDPNM